ncbi:hypothetical protein LTR05_002963 [Lithohypha guttulata]|uniref:TLC domain-containing protein n=1 Tax=Lithohypha guttulata TaxID=1690604 RepID=A0AAN7T4V2_9EURO|nr:hypothetical protein LTR05_002963 [Lithohypha guttulata]
MIDPIPPPPPTLFNLAKPLADTLALPSLPHHIHEVLFAAILYQSVQSIISPFVSNLLFPQIYASLTKRTRVNWDVHVVSLVQSLLINTLALWVMFTDNERYEMRNDVKERVYGYTGASGLIQALACGYFVWDLVRPFCNYYGPVFILYELSSPFLNVHWFCDKLNMTGSKLQWYNGMVLLFTFFSCRLVWGTYQSIRVYYDVWQILKIDTTAAFRQGHDLSSTTGKSIFNTRDGQLCMGDSQCVRAQSEVMKFVNLATSVPYWLIAVYLVSNVTLNALNWYWFGKMIETVMKRFEGKPHDEYKNERDMVEKEKERRKSVVEHAADTLDREVLTGPVTPGVEKIERLAMSSGSNIDGATEVNRRRRDL